MYSKQGSQTCLTVPNNCPLLYTRYTYYDNKSERKTAAQCSAQDNTTEPPNLAAF